LSGGKRRVISFQWKSETARTFCMQIRRFREEEKGTLVIGTFSEGGNSFVLICAGEERMWS